MIRAERRGAVRDTRVVAAIAGLTLALIAAWCSLPPTVAPFGLPIATPSGLIYRLTSTWRDYSRFVELVELGLCLAMAFAIERLLSARRVAGSRLAVRAAIVAALGLVLVLDLCGRARRCEPPRSRRRPSTSGSTRTPAGSWPTIR